MATITFNVDKIKNEVQPKLNNSKTYLDSAKNIISKIAVPNDFAYSTLLKSSTTKINTIKTNINNIYKWTDEVANKFQEAEKKNARLSNSIKANINKSGAKLSTNVSVNKSQKNGFLKSATNALKSTGASIANAFVSLNKGVFQFGEGIVDVGAMIGTGVASIVTGGFDSGSYIVSTLKGDKENWKSLTSKMWKGTMSFVATDHVGNAVEKFYKNDIVGQALQKWAYSPFKPDGLACNISSGVGYVAGIVALTVATAGLGTAASVGVSAAGSTGAVAGTAATNTMVSATIAGISGFGKYTAEYWEKVRNSSWEGITEMYENGEIDKDSYEQYEQIRNLSDEEWDDLTAEYENGNISKEDYENIKTIRDIPEDWTTLNNATTGIGYGAANGVWEALQWYVGGKLGDLTIKSASKLATSAVKIGVDTGFNALDTPFRTIVDTITSDIGWKEAWENQGGWISLLASVGIGLIGSVGGEMSNIRQSNITIDDIDSYFINYNDAEIVEKSSGHVTLSDIENYFKKFLFEERRLRAQGITDTQITEACSKVFVGTRADLERIFKQIRGTDLPPTAFAFNHNGISYLPENAAAGVVLHEILHSLGSLFDKSAGINKYRGINEAFTDNIANNLTGKINKGGYMWNAEIINNINMVLEGKFGIKNLDFETYFGQDKSIYRTCVDTIARRRIF